MDRITKVMGISMGTNIFLSILKIVTGMIGKSGALIADGLHSFSDLATDLIAVVGNHLSKKPADEKHPYGHGKIEYITSIVISLVILFLGGSIIYGSIQKEIVIPSLIVSGISLITIVFKFLLSRYIIKKGKEYHNNILLASGYESSTDVISSVVVFVSILLMQLSSIWGLFRYADMIASILVGLLIIKIGYDVLKENLSTILEEQETNEEYLNSLKDIILETKNIKRIDHLLVLKYGSYYKLVAEVSVDPKLSIMKAHQYAHEAENRLRNFDGRIIYVTIHVNPDQSYELIPAIEQDFHQIRTYYSKDHPKINLQNQMELQHYYMILVEEKKVGTLGYKVENKSLMIEELYIEEEYRNCKIGTSILKELEKKYKDCKIILWVSNENLAAISFYQNLGFLKKEQKDEYIKMEK